LGPCRDVPAFVGVLESRTTSPGSAGIRTGVERRGVGVVEERLVAVGRREQRVPARVGRLQREVDAVLTPALAGREHVELDGPGRVGRGPGTLAHRGAGRGERVPAAAEAGQPLPLHIAGALVAREVVERVTVVGDLGAPVGATAGAEQRAASACARPRLAAGDQRRPVLRALTVAGAGVALVARPQVQRLGVSIDEDPAETARRDAHRGALRVHRDQGHGRLAAGAAQRGGLPRHLSAAERHGDRRRPAARAARAPAARGRATRGRLAQAAPEPGDPRAGDVREHRRSRGAPLPCRRGARDAAALRDVPSPLRPARDWTPDVRHVAVLCTEEACTSPCFVG
jgi:hypothetical protein